MKKSKLLFISIASILVSLVLLTNFFVSVKQNIARADGPIQISTWAELNSIRSNLSGSYILMNDLNENTEGYATYAGPAANAGAGWDPIGRNAQRFTGSFDGNNFVIRNLIVNHTVDDDAGLFGAVGAANLDNITLENVDIAGKGYVGGLVGLAVNSTISNSFSGGDIDGSTDYVGGLVGYNTGSSISSSHSAGFVTSVNYTGGLVGGSSQGSISESYSECSVSGSSSTGGLVGVDNTSPISNSYSTGTVSGTFHAGGLVGNNTGSISSSYAAGGVSGVFFVGGLVGTNNAGPGAVTNSFYDSGVSGQSDTGKGVSKTTLQMKSFATFSDIATVGLSSAWDIVLIDDYVDEIWFIDDESDYPRLGWQLEVVEPSPDTTSPTFSNIPNSSDVINLTNGQVIATNPFVIKVKPEDNAAVLKVEFYVDDNLLCTDTTADSDGIYSCAWDTSKYHSTVKVTAYDTSNNASTILTREATVDPSLYTASTIPTMTELPNTGKNRSSKHNLGLYKKYRSEPVNFSVDPSGFIPLTFPSHRDAQQ